MALRCCCCAARGRMTTRERLFLTPMEKFVKYGRFPAKLVLNVALIILVTSSVLIMNSQSAEYVQNASRGFYRLFFPGW